MTANHRRKKGRSKNRMKRRIQLYTRVGAACLILLTVVLGGMKVFHIGPLGNGYMEITGADIDAAKPDIDVQLLTVNEYSRPGTKTERINGIVIHYTANPGSTAMQNRNYFEGLKDSHITKASSHFIVGLDGEIDAVYSDVGGSIRIQMTGILTQVSIETCHPNEDGNIHRQPYKSMVQLTAWLCKKFDLTEKM